ncbi:hypothetical protein DH2020_001366 [Rehmannia glutinosa]|uniref:LOB domain-containing protein n=1 Tax=Rehmannia glutinosa TaxID=99300 RepID=A0ABR0XZ42_REHGL
MTGSGSPCGACKFLRRKCVRGCVFAPYFCHEQGATHFAAIHKVFGASNVSKLLAHLPVSDRCEAAVTISYEAQARLQDPIYGCVSHIFALQQQELQAAQSTMTNSNNNSTGNPNHQDQRFYGETTTQYSNFPQDVQSWWQSIQNQGTIMPQFDPNFENMPYCASGTMNIEMMNPSLKYESSFSFQEENTSFGSMDSNERQWPYQDDHDLQSLAFRYINQH